VKYGSSESLDNVDQIDDSDDAAERGVARDHDVVATLDPLDRFVAPTRAGVDQQGAAVGRAPRAIFHPLDAGDDEVGPGLADRESYAWGPLYNNTAGVCG
jgi:hypothetical protein